MIKNYKIKLKIFSQCPFEILKLHVKFMHKYYINIVNRENKF